MSSGNFASQKNTGNELSLRSGLKRKSKSSTMRPGKTDGIPISEAEARVVAHVCGDGSIFSYQAKRFDKVPRRNPTKMEYAISYCNTEPSLIESFSKDVKELYGRKAFKSQKHAVTIRAKWIYQRLKRFGAGKSREWVISDEILNADKPIIREWLRAFFDDEAHVALRDLRITVNSVNSNGLEQVQGLLKKMRIENTSFNGPYRYKECDIYRLSVLKEDVERFQVYVGFNHPKKARDLEELLELRELSL